MTGRPEDQFQAKRMQDLQREIKKGEVAALVAGSASTNLAAALVSLQGSIVAFGALESPEAKAIAARLEAGFRVLEMGHAQAKKFVLDRYGVS